MIWSSLPVLPDPQQGMLPIFDRWAEAHCPLYEDCGCGATPPCGCIHPEPERRYQCGDCNIICLERRRPPYGRTAERAIGRTFAESSSLEQVSVRPVVPPTFPVLIPTRTDELPTTRRLDLAWVAMDAKQLLGRVKLDGSVRSRIAGYGPDRLRGVLRVRPETQILGVLNGADSILEGFWKMRRGEFYQSAAQARIAWFTGPTFSVVQEGPKIPASHNVAMLRRHSRVLQEIGEAGLPAAPNLYWRDERGRHRWVEWLHRNEQVWVVSRDFSRSKPSGPFRSHLNGLIDVVKRVDRPLHVLLVGVGPGNGGVAIRRLAEVGATCSVVTAAPIGEAMFGGKQLRRTPSGHLIASPAPGISRFDLIVPNIEAAEEHLLRITRDLPGYSVSRSNTLPSPVAVEPGTADRTMEQLVRVLE